MNARKEIKGIDVVDTGTALAGQLRHMARNDLSIIKHVLRTQRTLRLVKIIPTWKNLITSQYGHELMRALGGPEIQRYRAWFMLLFEITTPKQEKNRIELAFAYLKARKLKLAYGKTVDVQPHRFGITDEELAEKIRFETLLRYEALQPVS